MLCLQPRVLIAASAARRPWRCAEINPLLLVVIGGLVVAGLLVALLPGSGRRAASGDQPLTFLVAAGIRTPIEEILEMYREEHGVEVDVQYNASNMLLNQLKVDKFKQPDLYLAADSFYTDKAVELGLAAEVMPLARQEPVIAFRSDAGHQISDWQQLLEPDMRWSVAAPDQAAVGRSLQQVLQQFAAGDGEDAVTLWDRLEKRTTDNGVFKTTVNEVANDIKIGAVDVGVVWSSTVAAPEYRDELTAVRLVDLSETAEVSGIGDLVTVGVLTSSTRPTEALRLARYISARDRGLPVFESFGMAPVEGDLWALEPTITFFCGAVNRRAIEPVIDAFQQREGVVVNTIYDGCGILTSRMGTIEDQSQDGGFPDVYMACDRYYLENVQQWFQEDVDVSETEIVLVVPKGSDSVQSLQDLVKPGVRVSIGEPDQCTIGALTRRLLRQAGLYEALQEKQAQADEVVVEKSSSALIVPDVLTGHVDVAIAYRNDVIEHGDQVDVIQIDSPLTRAIQPLSIAKNSPHKQLVRRLYRQVEKAQSNFESVGFDFLFADPPGTF